MSVGSMSPVCTSHMHAHAATSHWRADQRAFAITRQFGHNVHAKRRELIVVLCNWASGPELTAYDHALVNVEPAA